MEKITNFKFNTSVIELIKKRSSIRSYKAEPLSTEIKDKIKDYAGSLEGSFSSNVRLDLVDSKIVLEGSNIKLGTYGIIKGASSFIVSALEPNDMSLLELGFRLENVILYATSLGLGTCWLGGTFKKGEFAKAIGLNDNEILPIVSPIGYPSENKNILGSLVRLAAGSKGRKNWSELFFDKNFNTPLAEAAAGKFHLPLEMVRLSPSASNKQPWRIIKENDTLHFYSKIAKNYSKALGYDIQRIDIGIAMCHFQMSAEEIKLDGCWSMCEPNLPLKDDSINYIMSWKSHK